MVVVYFEVILNRIEVFKVNNFDGNLGGPNPELLVTPPPPDSSNSTDGKSKMKRSLLLAGFGALWVCLPCFFYRLAWLFGNIEEAVLQLIRQSKFVFPMYKS